LTIVSISPIIFRWPHPFIVTCIFIIGKSVCYIHQLWYCPWFDLSHFFD
jgi:hypothetical protein